MAEPERREPTRRLFFALWPDDETRRQLVDQTRKSVRQCGGKPVPPGNYHLTLAYLGPVAASRLDAVVRAGRATPSESMPLIFDRVGHWQRARVLWAGLAQCPPELHELVAGLWGQLERLGFEREARAFRPHLTLCRKVGQPVERKFSRLVAWQTSGFVLVESDTTQKQSVYSVLRRYPD